MAVDIAPFLKTHGNDSNQIGNPVLDHGSFCRLQHAYGFPSTFGHLTFFNYLESTEIPNAGGKFAVWMLPQLFAFAINFPIQKFLQAQRKVPMVMAWVSALVLMLHAFFSSLLMFNTSWWLIVIEQLFYIFITKSDDAWCGFLWLASAIMLWHVSFLPSLVIKHDILFDIHSICVVENELQFGVLIPGVADSHNSMIITGWDLMIAVGFSAAISVRVSNELGAGNTWLAKFSVLVVSITSVSMGFVCMILVLATKDYFPYLFTNSVAVGAGWQSLVAYLNIGCYYIVGLPAGILLGFTSGLGVMGIWSGMIGGIVLQTLTLVVVTSRTNWNKEVSILLPFCTLCFLA
ncbi:hypothetical protein DITRI_Ditri03aG0201300 [Diplodiscus trichospermus]